MGELSQSETLECVVVAEDSAPNRKVLVLLLQKFGFEVIECEDGDDAWRAIEEEYGKKNIVAVFSDLMMPKMDGLEFLRRVRNSERTRELPFVFVTAVSDADYIMEARSLKSNGYILKPVTYQRLAAKLKELFPERAFPQMAS